jgi:hypothetical protein
MTCILCKITFENIFICKINSICNLYALLCGGNFILAKSRCYTDCNMCLPAQDLRSAAHDVGWTFGSSGALALSPNRWSMKASGRLARASVAVTAWGLHHGCHSCYPVRNCERRRLVHKSMCAEPSV